MESAVCEICSEVTLRRRSGCSRNSHLLWRYLYHENIGEAVTPAGNQDHINNLDTHICERCAKELETLENHYRSLEEIKRKMDVQVARINRFKRDKGKGETERSRQLPPREMVFAGATQGTGNVCQALQFLTKICEGIPSEPIQFPENPSIPSTISVEPVYEKDDGLLPIDTDNYDFEIDPLSDFTETCDGISDSLEADSDLVILESSSDAKVSNSNVGYRGHQPVPVITNAVSLKFESHSSTAGTSRSCGSSGVNARKKTRTLKQCPICEKIMSANNYAQHWRLHTGEKPYKCEFCPAKFAQKPSYNQHVKTHFNSRSKLGPGIS